MRAQLVPIKGGHPIQIHRDVTVVGRQEDLCDVCIDRSSISKLHCLIVRTDGLLFIRDLGSTNGTKVNGQRVIRGALLPGDELAFAGEKFRVEMGPGEPDSDLVQVQSAHTEVIELPRGPDPDERFATYGSEQPLQTASDSDVRPLSDEF
jgi:pSer/pThr/pTyr-binding forkhead associated (FHA) protein